MKKQDTESLVSTSLSAPDGEPAGSWVAKAVCLVLMGIVVLGIGMLVLAGLVAHYTKAESDAHHEAQQQIALHLSQVAFAIEATAWTGLPWNEAMHLTAACLKPNIIAAEHRHGFR